MRRIDLNTDIGQLYDELGSLDRVADAVGVSVTVVRRNLKEAGVKLRLPGRPKIVLTVRAKPGG